MGDLASADAEGRLWFAGRKTHVVHTADGPLFSVPCEEVFRRHPAVRRCALVGVGDVGTQRPVLIVEPEPGPRDDQELTDALLAVGTTEARTRPITTVLFHPGLPVDPRHNSKIDREALAGWAATRVTP
jgi:acyl-coenzyme A synthetase/AMP-(fatty) acid ligase